MRAPAEKSSASRAIQALLGRFMHAGLLFALLTGCITREPDRLALEPPRAGAHSIFVVGSGFHTGILVRSQEVPVAAWPARRDFPNADYLELGWGDREYYTRENPGLWRAVRALVTPTASAINAVPVNGPLQRSLPESEIVELRVSDEGFQRMVAFVRDSHELDASGGAIVVNSDVRAEGRFYASARTFHMFENCNGWVAHALHAAGVAVHPDGTITAGGLLRQVRRLSIAAPAPA